MKKYIIKLLPILILAAAALTAAVRAADDVPSAVITAVELNGSNTKVTVRATVTEEFFAANAESDVFLMEMKAWNGSVLPADSKPVAQTKLSKTEFSLTCGFDVSTDRYDSFMIAIKDGGGYLPVSQPRFVEDASVFSPRESAYPTYATKKGLISSDVSDIVLTGAAQTVLEIRADEIMLPEYAENALAYTYAGNTYYADRAALDALDAKVRALDGANVNIFAEVSLSGVYRGGDGRLASLYYSEAPDGADAYALNTSSESASTSYTAFIDFLARRYGVPGGEDGFIGSWIVGKAANTAAGSARGDLTDEQYIESYQRVLRLTDTAVRSVWKNARVYVPVSNAWNVENGGKSFLSSLAACVKLHGDFPWRVAVAAYASDPSLAAVWTDTWATDGEDTKYVTVKNIAVLCDFLAREDIAYNGTARNIAVTDFAVNGSPDSPGDMTPAASFAYAYYKAAFDGRIDALIWSSARDAAYPEAEPQTSSSVTGEDGSDGKKDETKDAAADSSTETGETAPAPSAPTKLYFGLYTSAGVKKPVCDVFTRVEADLPSDPNFRSGDAASFALSMIGVPDWKDVAPGYDKTAAVRYNFVESMPIMSSDISGRVKTTSSVGFENGVGTFYSAGARYVELRTADGPKEKKTAVLYAGLPDNFGSSRAGVACPMVMKTSAAKYVSFQIYVAAPTDVASVAVNVALTAGGEEKLPALFTGAATVKPNSWQEVTFRCEDLASIADTTDTLSVFVSSYDGLDHEGKWGLMIDDLVTYGAKTSKLLPILGKLIVVALILAVIFAALVFILRVRNVRRIKRKRVQSSKIKAQR